VHLPTGGGIVVSCWVHWAVWLCVVKSW